MSRGMARKEAEQAARRAFGNVALIEQRSREVWQWAAIESVLADLRLTLRRLGKSPGFAATVLLTLAIGIGANTAVFSVVDNVLLKPLPYPDSDRLVSLWLNAPGSGIANFSEGLNLSPSMYFTFLDHNRSFASMGVWAPRTANVTGLAQPEDVRTALVSDGVLQTLATPPALGRWFSQTDEDPRGAKTVMLSYGYWQRRFGGEPGVIGRSIQVDSVTREVVGVMPRGFRMVDQDFDLLVPLAPDRAHQGLAPFFLNGVARLKPGVTLEQADADVSRLIGLWMDSWSNGPGTNSHYYEVWRISPNFRYLKRQVIGAIDRLLWVVMATVGLVMLIASVNVANLLMVRAESRQQELSIRAALGAGRARITRELLTESLLLGVLGGVLSIAVAYGGLRLLKAFGPGQLPRLSEVSLDGYSLLFTLLLSIFCGLLFGSIPAFKYARAKASDALSSSRTAGTGRVRNRSRNVLVVAQVAMALVLLVSAVLMIRTFMALRDVQPGFSDAAHVQTIQIAIPEALIPDEQMVTRVENNIADQLAAIPEVTGVGFAAAVPLDANGPPNWDQILVEGKDYSHTEPPMRLYNYASPGYFQTMGTHLLAGRDFTWTDIYSLRHKVIVSENFARESWGSAVNAVGKRVHEFQGQPWEEVIGVVEDVHQNGVDEKAPVIIYWPVFAINPYVREHTVWSRRFVTFAIHSRRAGNEAFLSQLRQAVWSVNASLPVAGLSTMEETYAQSLARTSFTLVMLAIAGSMALALGVIGIYGVISYAISQRTREIGIRMALGAQKSELKWMFVRSALVLTMAGIAIGSCAAAALSQGMRALLFGISPLDPLTYLAVLLALGLSAVVASYLPARRAAGVNPAVALRTE
jgi:predicted permease